MINVRRFLLPEFVQRKLAASHGLRRIARNTAWQLADRLLRMGIGLVVAILTARHLGPAQFGELALAVTAAALLSAFTALGIDAVIVRNIVRDADARFAILGTSLTLRLLTGSLGAVGLSLAAGWLPDDGALVPIIAPILILHSFDVIDLWFQSQVQIGWVVAARLASFLAAAVGKLLLIVHQAPVAAFAWAHLGEACLTAAALAVAYRCAGQRLRDWRFDPIVARSLLRDAGPLLLSSVFAALYMRMDQFFLAWFSTAHELGVYCVAVRFAEVWYVIPAALASSTYPSVVAALGASPELLHRRMQRLYDVVSLICYAIAIPVTVVAPWVIALLYGERFAGAGPALMILIWTLHFTGLGMARSSYLTARNLLGLHTLTVLSACLVNLALNVLLIPAWGAVGAAFASVIAYAFATLGACFLFKPLRPTGWMIGRALLLPRIAR